MCDKDNAAREIGRVFDRALGPGPGISTLEMHKRLIKASVEQRTRVRSRRRFVRTAAAGIVLCLAVGVAEVVRQSSAGQEHSATPRFKIGEAVEYAAMGRWVKSTEKTPVPIIFDRGSRFVLKGKSSAMVSEVRSEQVTIQLHQGRLESTVNGDGVTRWTVQAGPYTVTVLGTVFSVDWQTNEGQLEVSVQQGRVRISDQRDASEVVLVSGERLAVNSETGNSLVTKMALKNEQSTANRLGEQVISGDEVRENEKENPSPQKKETTVERNTVSSRPGDQKTNHDTSSSRLIAPSSDDRLQVSARTPLGPHREERQMDAEEELLQPAEVQDSENDPVHISLHPNGGVDLDTLWQRANRERYLKRADQATKLFQSLRRRFPASGRAQTAAFLIGKIALEQQRDPRVAQKWFEQYLREAKTGRLAADAIGYLMEIYDTTGQEQKARKAANQYLERFAGGPFSSLAQSIQSR